MPILPEREQPTVAVITLLYCEKQAVDAMMESKTTYVRYKTEGKLYQCIPGRPGWRWGTHPNIGRSVHRKRYEGSRQIKIVREGGG